MKIIHMVISQTVFFYRAVLNKEPVCWMCPGIISVALHGGGVLFFNAPKQSEA
jgi:hypothetical protein